MRTIPGALLVAAALTAGLSDPASAQRPSTRPDTPADVMKAGQSGLTAIDNALVALTEARAVMAKMASDQGHARAILQLAEKNDRASIVKLLKVSAPRSAVQITHLEDFTIAISITFGGIKVDGCASSENKCGGVSATLAIKGP